MANKGSIESLKEESICSICLDIFQDPVIVECGHSFCRHCITEFWGITDNDSCPRCRKVSVRRALRPNNDLKNLVAVISKLSVSEQTAGEVLFCENHEEKYKLYCEDDETPLCLVCEKSRNHRDHNVIPIQEAITEKKAKLTASVERLQQHVETIVKAKFREEKIYAAIKTTVENERRRINAEFAQMHEFLYKENEILLAQLEEEEKTSLEIVNNKIQALSEQKLSLNALIADIESQLKLQDASFLKVSKSAFSRCEQPLPQVPAASSGFNSDKYYFPVQYFAWKKMLPIIKPAPFPLILDADTVHRLLAVSSDLRELKWGVILQRVPDSPKRFGNSYTCALSSTGFTSGTHYWEVQLEGRGCIVGAVLESYLKEMMVMEKSKHGFCTVSKPGYWSNHSLNCEKVGVYLNYGRGQLSFYNAENMTCLSSYNYRFSEKLIPLFWVPDKFAAIKLFHLQL